MPASFIPDPTCHHCHALIETGTALRRLTYKGEEHEYHVTCLNKLRKPFRETLMRSMPYEQAYRIVNTFTTAS